MTRKKRIDSRALTVDAYLAALGGDTRAALGALRRLIARAAPQAEECISYGLPAFRQGSPLVAFGATENHCALYLLSGSTVAAHATALAKYDTSKGTIRFPADTPLPAALVRTLVRARLAENEERARTAASTRRNAASARRRRSSAAK